MSAIPPSTYLYRHPSVGLPCKEVVATPLRLQRYNKKMTLANKSAIFMHFCPTYGEFYVSVKGLLI